MTGTTLKIGLLGIILNMGFIPYCIADQTVTKTVDNKNTGKFTVAYPKDWKFEILNKMNPAASRLRMMPADKKFQMRMEVNTAVNMRLLGIKKEDLDGYIQYHFANSVNQSMEKEIKTHRFGANHEGLYAMLTDAKPKPGEFKYWTKGIRLIGDKLVVFDLFANSKKVTKRVLPVVESVTFQ